MPTSEVTWVVEPTDKFPEWIEFNGRRYPCKLTKKRIIMDKGVERISWGQKRRGMRRDTFYYDTSVPDWGDGLWYGIESGGMYDSFHEAPRKLDPSHDKASPAVLNRLAQVRKSLELRRRQEKESKDRLAEMQYRRSIWDAWYLAHLDLETQLRGLIKEGKFDEIDAVARQIHTSWQEQPPPVVQ